MRVVVGLLTAGLVVFGAWGCGRMGHSPLASIAGNASPLKTAESAGGAGLAGGGSIVADSGIQLKSGRAILIRGPLIFRGLPFFAPNALPGLSGEYLLSLPAPEPTSQGSSGASASPQTLRLRVWYTREPLYFDAGWTRGALGRYTIYTSRRGAAGAPVIAFALDRYELFVELPADSAALRRFAAALEDRFALFFAEAATDADLSFPSFVDFVP
jgi:hypothetical protein